MVHRSTVAASLVVVLALLAGCSGLLGDSGPGSPQEFEYADGFSADGVTDDAAANRSYRNALTDENSFTVYYEQNVTAPQTNVSYDVVYRVDVAGERAYHRVQAPSLDYRLEQYHGDGRMVEREVRSGNEQVNAVDSEFTPGQLTGVGAFGRLLSNDTDYETRVAERDGTPVVVYETEGAESAATVFAVDAANVTSFRASFAVDSEGVVRTASYELEAVRQNGGNITVTFDFEVRDVGGTSVERPGWVNES